MRKLAAPTLAEDLRKLSPTVRSTVQAARRTVKAIAPETKEINYDSSQPRSKSMVWKLVRYAKDDANVVGIGALATYASLFFYRGRELDHGSGLLEGGGKEMRFIRLRSPADAERPAVKRMVREAFRLRGS